MPLATSPSARGTSLGVHQRRSRVKPGARCAAVQPAPRTYEQSDGPGKESIGIFSSMIDRLVPSFTFFFSSRQSIMASYRPDGLSESSFQHTSHSASSMPSPVAPTLAHILYYHTISALSCFSPSLRHYAAQTLSISPSSLARQLYPYTIPFSYYHMALYRECNAHISVYALYSYHTKLRWYAICNTPMRY